MHMICQGGGNCEVLIVGARGIRGDLEVSGDALQDSVHAGVVVEGKLLS